MKGPECPNCPDEILEYKNRTVWLWSYRDIINTEDGFGTFWGFLVEEELGDGREAYQMSGYRERKAAIEAALAVIDHYPLGYRRQLD
jgi:hypothetical protein